MQRILIIRLSAMGDILHAIPAVTALRKALPQAYIGWVIEDRWADLVRAGSQRASGVPRGPGMPLLDRIHYVDTQKWRKSPLSGETRREMSSLRAELRKSNYEIALDLQGSVRSALIARSSGAKERIGAEEPRERLARWFYTKKVPTPGVHVVDQALETASAAVTWQLSPQPAMLPVDPEAERWSEDLLRDKRKFVIVNPGAGWGAKCWPADRYGSVAGALAGEGWRVFVNAGPQEHELGKQVVDSSGGKAELLTPTVAQLMSLTRKTSLFIGGDTGPMHLAAALRKPVVGIFGPTDPRRNGPFGTRKVILRNPESKRDHTRRSEPEAGLLTITTSQVLDASHMLLENLSG